MASYLARQAIHAGWRAGLVANTHLRRGRGPLRVTAASSAGQESVLFTALARMPNQPTDDLAPILREVGRRLTRRTTVVVLSANPGPSLTHEMERLRRRGSDVIHVAPDARGRHVRGPPRDAIARGAGRRRAAARPRAPWRPPFPPRWPRRRCGACPCTPWSRAARGRRSTSRCSSRCSSRRSRSPSRWPTRYRTSTRVAPIVAVGAIVAGVLLARGGAQREIFVVLLFLLLGLRAVGLAFRDWREPDRRLVPDGRARPRGRSPSSGPPRRRTGARRSSC